ncbi:hypothetical protein T4B_10367 [Trichinella pseudospiralis]|uniref:Uncharacterized protein n=1 Tax=Trichinella pseudospiralis TaxID=6337 RepID=A0A0V1DVU6_TRIPS|nr:hypothetical protein T4A_8221 [Trichinella pseudospiralis]KRZ00116.1 hypothetical protein T4B_6165 [Trichinella pseudospiralis]KRZ00168.1 hypothetical protein T4B_1056 [Trichinella pseudospiralis]KRZ00186.1 hypothetical protein T4B_10367 [Trichinella pseudospiralis]KRZ19859.1 hypothetical protein T4C_11032 [Trichinella pseudospiralis]
MLGIFFILQIYAPKKKTSILPETSVSISEFWIIPSP